jgi:hypothetical protein
MIVSQTIRNVLLVPVTMALMLLTAIGLWLMDEQSARQMKEKRNG